MTAAADNADSVKLIRTLDQLRAWADDAPVRHARVDDGKCACGWESPAYRDDPTWEQHVEGGPIHDLGDFLPSNTYDTRSGHVSFSDLETDLYATIDHLHEVGDLLLDALTNIALRGGEDSAYAAAVVCRLYPQSVWAEAIRDQMPVDESLAGDIPDPWTDADG